jgi:hypothetical protein
MRRTKVHLVVKVKTYSSKLCQILGKMNQQATADSKITIATLVGDLAGFCGISRTNQVVPPSGHGAKADATSTMLLHSHPCCLMV